MKSLRSLTPQYAALPVLFAMIIGCNKNESKAAWEDALDASNEEKEEDKPETKPNNQKDAGDDESSTSTGKTQSSTAATDDESTASTSSTAGATSSTGESESSDVNTTEPDESTTTSEGSDEEVESSTAPENDAGNDTSEEQPAGNGCDGYLLCETFEDVEVGQIPEGWNSRGEGAAVSADDAHDGERALKISAGDPGPRQIVRDASLLGAAHWGRVYYRVELPVPDAFVHTTIVAFSGEATESGPSEFRVVNMNKQAADTPNVGSKHNWAYNVQVTGGGEWVCESNYDREFDADWHCAEYFVDAEAQSYELYLDEQAVDLGDNCDRWELPMLFDELRVGWNYYADAPPGFTAYIDDIAFDDERIGCD